MASSFGMVGWILLAFMLSTVSCACEKTLEEYEAQEEWDDFQPYLKQLIRDLPELEKCVLELRSLPWGTIKAEAMHYSVGTSPCIEVFKKAVYVYRYNNAMAARQSAGKKIEPLSSALGIRVPVLLILIAVFNFGQIM